MTNGDPNLPALPPPGWYADPMDAAQERWWSGEGWSEHERALPTTVVMDAEVPQYASVTAPEPEYARALAPAAMSPFGDTYPASAGEYSPMSSHAPGAPRLHAQFEVGSPNTVFVWGVASYPLSYAVAVLATATWDRGDFVRAGVGVGVFAMTLLAAIFDHLTLKRRGLSAPSAAWILLTGVGYLVARNIALGRDGVKHHAPGWVFLASVIVGGSIIAMATPQVLAASGLSLPGAVTDRDAIRTLETTLETSLDEQTTSTWLVSCPETQDISVDGTRFACNGTNAAGERALISIEVAVPQNFIVTRMDRVQ
jgi:hypothetical protein